MSRPSEEVEIIRPTHAWCKTEGEHGDHVVTYELATSPQHRARALCKGRGTKTIKIPLDATTPKSRRRS